MSDLPARLKTLDRAALGVLCSIFTASVAMRVHTHVAASRPPYQASETIDLGGGLFLPRVDAVSQTVFVNACVTPATIYFVPPALYGVGPSLNAVSDPKERIFYVYRGQILGGRFASTELSIGYVEKLALDSWTMAGSREVGDLAMKMIVPAGCDATPTDVVAAFEEQMHGKH